MIVLGIESSCDETAAALVRDDGKILSNVIAQQIDDHAPFGGVVPEIAARAHLAHMDKVVALALAESPCDPKEIDAIAATGGPGLIGGVIVGIMTAKALALAWNKPFIPINHLEGHALTARLTDKVSFPYLLLLTSGGHCQLLIVEGLGRYRLLGSTIDDAAGEAFDKAAKLLGLGFPGGPAIEKEAKKSTSPILNLPRPMMGRATLDFSFSGLKTALRLAIEAKGGSAALDDKARADFAAGFEQAIIDCLADRTKRALAQAQELYPNLTAFVASGGVAANSHLRLALQRIATEGNVDLILPPVSLCTDNAAMIAWAGIEYRREGKEGALDFAPRPRWPLEELAVSG